MSSFARSAPGGGAPGPTPYGPRARADAAAASGAPGRDGRRLYAPLRARSAADRARERAVRAVRVGGEPPDRHGAERVAGEEHGARAGAPPRTRAAASPGTPPPANAAPISGASAAPMAAAAFAATPAAAAANAPVAADQSMRVVSAAAAAAARDPARHLPRRGAPGAATRNAATARFRPGPPAAPPVFGSAHRRASVGAAAAAQHGGGAHDGAPVRRAWRAGGGERAQVGDDQPLLDARQPDLVRRGGVHARAVEGVAPRARNLDGAAETPSFRRYTRASVFVRESSTAHAAHAVARSSRKRQCVRAFREPATKRGGSFQKRRAARRRAGVSAKTATPKPGMSTSKPEGGGVAGAGLGGLAGVSGGETNPEASPGSPE